MASTIGAKLYGGFRGHAPPPPKKLKSYVQNGAFFAFWVLYLDKFTVPRRGGGAGGGAEGALAPPHHFFRGQWEKNMGRFSERERAKEREMGGERERERERERDRERDGASLYVFLFNDGHHRRHCDVIVTAQPAL